MFQICKKNYVTYLHCSNFVCIKYLVPLNITNALTCHLHIKKIQWDFEMKVAIVRTKAKKENYKKLTK